MVEHAVATTTTLGPAEAAGSTGKPLPLPDDATEAFWAAANEGRLVIQQCSACGRFIHAPKLMCPACGCEELRMQPVSGRGTLYAFTLVREAATRGFDPPYLVAVVELAEQPGLFCLSNLVGVAPGEAVTGMPVEVTFERIGDGCMLPQFRPAAGGQP